ncbi:MAG: hypothetical protein HONBIEJF_02238 [Fimbriimonadaceae bacterium]|nr:hypothetical protein [Fimbriimonadaceae bacterium]
MVQTKEDGLNSRNGVFLILQLIFLAFTSLYFENLVNAGQVGIAVLVSSFLFPLMNRELLQGEWLRQIVLLCSAYIYVSLGIVARFLIGEIAGATAMVCCLLVATYLFYRVSVLASQNEEDCDRPT